VGPRLHDVAPGGIGDGILLFCPPGFCDVGGLLRALSSSGGWRLDFFIFKAANIINANI
jgi:hypothetical protein